MAVFEVTLSADRSELIDGADAYQLEGPLTTFFRLGGSRTVIDSWSTRLASFRTADIVTIRRVGAETLLAPIASSADQELVAA